ncbi:4-hydroxythreonine-4-phosphate dehydrogenase [Actinidia chinensis var. chinensis]|uniref:4-hydroxythreonine-4-phosphate dehydrogenase n=1 Tax=Actinidia chinensis var. chinensis TaxID=1590841 RepID=A0A2R6PMK6_ACTCC|nr:4-hydroxythreonine-4-phosphate dehydrogenase [Actinidia chinensis var. chinensis]
MYSIDLRFLFPALVNILLLLFPSDVGNPWGWDSDNPIMSEMTWQLLSLFVFLIIIVPLLVVSITVPVSFSIITRPIRLRFSKWSRSLILAVALLASFKLPPLFFWYAYLIFLSVSPWWSRLCEFMKRTLQSFPSRYVVCTTGQDPGLELNVNHEHVLLMEPPSIEDEDHEDEDE